jgi:hypothetical protein
MRLRNSLRDLRLEARGTEAVFGGIGGVGGDWQGVGQVGAPAALGLLALKRRAALRTELFHTIFARNS